MHKLMLSLTVFGISISLVGLKHQSAQDKLSNDSTHSGTGYYCNTAICRDSSGCLSLDGTSLYQVFPTSYRKGCGYGPDPDNCTITSNNICTTNKTWYYNYGCQGSPDSVTTNYTLACY